MRVKSLIPLVVGTDRLLYSWVKMKTWVTRLDISERKCGQPMKMVLVYTLKKNLSSMNFYVSKLFDYIESEETLYFPLFPD